MWLVACGVSGQVGEQPVLGIRQEHLMVSKQYPNPGIEGVASDRVPGVPRPEVAKGPAQKVAPELTPYQISLIA